MPRELAQPAGSRWRAPGWCRALGVAAVSSWMRALTLRKRLGDFLGLRLEIFSKHIKASSDDTGDHPYNH